MRKARLCLIAVAFAALASPVHAQSVAVGGGVHRSIQRFDGDSSLNRLNGDSLGWVIAGTVRASHWLARGEFSRDSTIRDVDATTLLVGARTVTVHSELAHDLSDVAALGGYAFNVTRRFELAALAGASWVTVDRTFTTDAAQQILVPPSAVPASPASTMLSDRFVTWTAEGSGIVRLGAHVGVMAGLRLSRLQLKEDIHGWSVAPFIGAVWQLK